MSAATTTQPPFSELIRLGIEDTRKCRGQYEIVPEVGPNKGRVIARCATGCAWAAAEKLGLARGMAGDTHLLLQGVRGNANLPGLRAEAEAILARHDTYLQPGSRLLKTAIGIALTLNDYTPMSRKAIALLLEQYGF